MTEGRRRARGFTLLEVMVVLFIIGLGWFSLLPRLDSADVTDSGPLTELNDFLDLAKADAVRLCRPQVLNLGPGSDLLSRDEAKMKLPAPVLSALVNGYAPPGTVYSFKVYPEGFMDAVTIRLSDDTVYLADVLRCRFTGGDLADFAPPDIIDTLRDLQEEQ